MGSFVCPPGGQGIKFYGDDPRGHKVIPAVADIRVKRRLRCRPFFMVRRLKKIAALILHTDAVAVETSASVPPPPPPRSAYRALQYAGPAPCQGASFDGH